MKAIPYSNVCPERGHEYFNYDEYKPDWDDMEHIELKEKIGKGKYSLVYLAQDSLEDKKVVVKILKPVRKSKIKRELKILDCVKDGPNVIRLLGKGKEKHHGTISMLFEYIYHLNLGSLVKKLPALDIKIYAYRLLMAIDYSHSQGIMHRDVKPGNIVGNPETKELRLIDWGL